MLVRILLCLIGFTGVLNAQTFTNTVTVQKDLRVQGETVLGGVTKLEDITMYADTIHIGNLDGTGNILGIDANNKVYRIVGSGTGGVTGFNDQQVLYGSPTGTLDQEAAFIYDEDNNLLSVTVNSEPDYGIKVITFGNADYNASISPEQFKITAGDLIGFTAENNEFIWYDVANDYTHRWVFPMITTFDYSWPSSQGAANTFLQNDGSGGLTWAAGSGGTVTSIGLGTGTSGTDVNVSGSPVTGSGTITLNIPDASTTARGLITTGTQDIAGAKTFTSNISFEGTADANETTLSITDPTADNTVTVQNITGTIPMAIGTDVALTGQNAAISFNTIYTPPADGWYRVNVNLVITTAATSSSQIGFRVRYTSAADGVVKTTSNANDITRTTANTTGTTLQYSFPIYVDGSTNIQYETSYTSTGSTAAVYAIYITLEKIK